MDPDLLLRALPHAARSWDEGSRTLVWGPHLARLGLDPAQVATPEAWLDRVLTEDRPRVAAALDELLPGGRWSGEYRVRRGDGTIATVVDHVAVGAGEVPVRVGVLEDVSDRRAAERALGAVEEMLEQTQGLEQRLAARDAAVLARERAAKSVAEATAADRATFATVLSHELRTPMNAVVALTAVLAETSLDGEQRELVETVQRSARHLLSLVEEVLDLSRLDAGRLELERRPFAVREVIEGALDMVAAATAERALDVGYVLAPSTAPGLVGDAARLRQVLLNLLGNAAKFTARGSVRVEVASVPRDGGLAELHVTVRDTGPGIGPERIHTLFQPFAQESPATARLYGGTGMGLAISKRLVELMGGSIGIASTPGVGTIVHFTIVAPRVAWEDPAVPDHAVPALGGKRVSFDVASAFERASIVDLLGRWGAVAATEAPIDVHLRDESAAPRPGVPEIVLRSGTRRSPGAAGHAVHLPLKPAQLFRAALAAVGAPLPAAPDRAARPDADAIALPPLDVLVAEDDRVSQWVASTLLRRAGHRPRIVDDGVMALEALEERRFDVVVVDLEMPRMGGLELARRIFATVRPAPTVIALTADATIEARRACAAAGVAEVLAKPITPERLAAALRRAPSAPPAPMSAASYTQLEGDLGAEGAAQIRQMFLEDAPAALAKIEAALASGDVRLAARTAHALRASCGLFLPRQGVVADLEALERAARQGDLDASTRIAARAVPALDALLRELRAAPHAPGST